MKYKLLSFLKLNTTYDFLTISKSLGSSTIYGLFALGAFFFTKQLLFYLLVRLKLGLFLVHEFFSIILFIFFLSVNIGNIIVSYSTLYKSQEVNFLFTKPISSSKIFIIKFLDNFFYSSGTLFFILLAVMAGYASYFELNILAVFLLLLTGFFPFMLSSAALGVIILLVIMKFSSHFGLRKIIAVLAMFYLLSIFFFFNLASPVELVNEVMQYYPNVDLYFGKYLPAFLKFMPNEWLSSSLYWLLKGKISFTLGYTLLQVSCSVLLIIGAFLLGSKWYKKTWLLLPAIRNYKNNSAKYIKKEITGKNLSIVKKDYLLFMREASQVIHAIILILMIFIFISSVSSVHLFGTQNTELRALVFLSVFIFNIFLLSTFSLRFVFPIISLEGNAFWKLKTSPYSYKKFLIDKIKPSYGIILFTSLLLSYFSTRLFSLEMISFSLIITFFVATSIIFLNFSMGGTFANYKEKNPIRIASSQGASVTFLGTIFYMTYILIVLYKPSHQYFEFMAHRIRFAEVDFITPTLILAGTSIFIFTFSLLFLKKSLKKDY